ncbi:unnamed protein product [Lathyrus oleraceus]|uniref:RING-type domain-containing protein n=1 Tax=Pisum sativum TaxID=3888 RepID=A0A9D4W9A8_PEA|nr:E3 ubiquitin protein ligase DRIP1-like isoform X2 [Pisum sativum]KAI5397845.1 hypothetical protein KIW84_063602 [Pisum sativum]
MEDVSVFKYEKVSPFFACILCDRTLRNAATISECLDTFCRECIERKIVDENLNHCPICNVDLGCSPLDKLRTDNNKKTMISKVLISTKEYFETDENVGSTQVVTKKRKNSRSSSQSNAKKAKKDSKKIKKEVKKGKKILQEPRQLQEQVLITPQEPKTPASEIAVAAGVKKDAKQQRGIEILDEVSTILSARKAKNVARKKFIRTELDSTSQPDKATSDGKKEDIRPRLETFTETPKIRFKSSSKPESSNQNSVFKNVSKDRAELRKEKAAAVSKPLNWFVETTNADESLNNSTLQGNGLIPMLVDSSDNDDSRSVSKVDINKHCNYQTEAGGDQNESVPSKSSSLKFKIKRVDTNQEKRVRFSEDLNLPAPPETETKKEFGPIWFSLIASNDRELGALPQISSHYLRVKDGSLTVSYIKKYLVKKLDLASEAEVEILLGGKPVYCSMQVQNLMEMWLETMSKKEMIQTSVGSSAKDFVMVLSYGRKA